MQKTGSHKDSIVAVITPPGVGAVGIVRVSGDLVLTVAEHICGGLPKSHQASVRSLLDASGELIDEALVIYFAPGASFTGEACLELQAHGSPVVLDRIISRCLELGVRLARPGEFSERAFLNGRIDLAQAEGIADLIAASSEQSSKAALNSLTGVFSAQINQLVDEVKALRCYTEAAVDFPEDENDLLAQGEVTERLQIIEAQIDTVLQEATQGVLIQEGVKLAILGPPNAGKSSLFNRLCGEERAIVTPIAGTTRDLIKESILIDQLPVHLLDTAGLRDTDDQIEQTGIAKAKAVAAQAGLCLYVIDIQALSGAGGVSEQTIQRDIEQTLGLETPYVLVFNKLDALEKQPENLKGSMISAQTGEGIEALKKNILQRVHFTPQEGQFTARRRHLDALHQAKQHLQQCLNNAGGVELMAEDLRLLQQTLCTITGAWHTEDLLGDIFSSFCMGK